MYARYSHQNQNQSCVEGPYPITTRSYHKKRAPHSCLTQDNTPIPPQLLTANTSINKSEQAMNRNYDYWRECHHHTIIIFIGVVSPVLHWFILRGCFMFFVLIPFQVVESTWSSCGTWSGPRIITTSMGKGSSGEMGLGIFGITWP